MEKILVSACLLAGGPWRYDGKSKALEDQRLISLNEEGRIIGFCPEVEGGLKVPRDPAERRGNLVVNTKGFDVTPQFTLGAVKAGEIAKEEGIKVTILKEGSPSCGSKRIYDGSFSGRKIQGMGLAAETLTKMGIRVFNEEEIDEALAFISSLEDKEE